MPTETTIEEPSSPPKRIERQNQFATLLGIEPGQLSGLELCGSCGGEDYQWTDWSLSEVDTVGMEVGTIRKAIEYRHYLASLKCDSCGGTGFEDGSFELNDNEWVALSNSRIGNGLKSG